MGLIYSDIPELEGTDTETALDIVSIDKSTRAIHCTRLGAGSDRVTSY